MKTFGKIVGALFVGWVFVTEPGILIEMIVVALACLVLFGLVYLLLTKVPSRIAKTGYALSAIVSCWLLIGQAVMTVRLIPVKEEFVRAAASSPNTMYSDSEAEQPTFSGSALAGNGTEVARKERDQLLRQWHAIGIGRWWVKTSGNNLMMFYLWWPFSR